MESYVFPILFPAGVMGLVAICILIRRYLRSSDQSAASRNALLMAMTRMPVGPERSMPPSAQDDVKPDG